VKARASLAVCLVAAAACGGERERERARAAEVAYRATAEGRTVVASVDGEPIYADCVEAQARAHGVDARAALDQCIDFELLALEARRRGLLADPEVAERSRREAVRAFIDADFGVEGPEHLEVQDLRRMWDRLPSGVAMRHFFQHGEVRRADYCLAKVPADAEPGGAEDLAARTLAEVARGVADALVPAGERALDAVCRMILPADRSQAVRGFIVEQSQGEQGQVEAGFFELLSSIEQVGEIAGPARSASGWFVIQLDARREAQHLEFEEALPKLRELVWHGDPWFEGAQWRWDIERFLAGLFQLWAGKYEQHAKIEVHPDRIPEEALAP
jgi:hypothetical protein